MHLPGRPGVARPEPLFVPARTLESCVDRRQFAIEQPIVVAELQQLAVREFKNVQRRLRARRRVVDQCGVPGRYDQVIGQVRDPVLQDGGDLLRAERLRFAAQHRCDFGAALGDQLLGGEGTIELVDREDGIVFRQVVAAIASHRLAGPCRGLPAQILGALFEIGALDQFRAERSEPVPRPLERLRQRHRDDPVIVEPDPGLERADRGQAGLLSAEGQRPQTFCRA